uniref:Uncharacterized protein n=1 Tax=Pavo cristatus TaxID=9049 RepID=A0A8C9EWG3_PAVCR
SAQRPQQQHGALRRAKRNTARCYSGDPRCPTTQPCPAARQRGPSETTAARRQRCSRDVLPFSLQTTSAFASRHRAHPGSAVLGPAAHSRAGL